MEFISEVPVEQGDNISILYMGGALVSVCNKCKKSLASNDCPFPGTKEQIDPIKTKMYLLASKHECAHE